MTRAVCIHTTMESKRKTVQVGESTSGPGLGRKLYDGSQMTPGAVSGSREPLVCMVGMSISARSNNVAVSYDA
jgi:hypothetical protein